MKFVTDTFYQQIGHRIKTFREKRQLTQREYEFFLDSNILDQPTISRIENGKVDAKKAPYLLSKRQLAIICEKEGLKPSEIVFGDKDEKESLCHMIAVAVLLNNNTNPFEKKSLSEWAEYEKNFNQEIKELAKKYPDQWLEYVGNKYGFFINSGHFEWYNRMECTHEKGRETASNLILKLLMTDYAFAESFIGRLFKHNINSEHMFDSKMSTSETNEIIHQSLSDFVTNKGCYDLLILDYKTKDYVLFIAAFNKFWDNYGKEYVNFFEEELFKPFDEYSISDSTFTGNREQGKYSFESGHPLKKIDIILNHILVSDTFIKFNQNLLLLSDYKSQEAFLANLSVRLSIQRILTENNLKERKDFEFLRTIQEMENALSFHKLIKKVTKSESSDEKQKAGDEESQNKSGSSR